MILLYDLIATQPEGSSPVSGGGEYAKRVFSALLETIRADHHGTTVHAVYQTTKILPENMRKLAEQHGIELHPVNRIEEVVTVVKRIQADRFYSALPLRYGSLQPGSTAPVFPESCEFIFTIHGLRPLELPWDTMEYHYFHSLRSVFRHLIPRILGKVYIRKRATEFRRLLHLAARYRVVTVSSHSLHSLRVHFPELPAEKVLLSYSPAENTSQNTLTRETESAFLERVGVESGSYFLVITANRWGKNSYRALEAIRRLRAEGLTSRRTVVAGSGSAPYLRKLKRRDAGGFLLLDYLGRAELETLYKHAYAFIFPTLNEGFGYPPIECMAHGTPVLTAGVSSIPELVGDAVLLVDPRNPVELKTRILQLDSDGDLYARLRIEGPRRATAVRAEQDRMLGELITLLTT